MLCLDVITLIEEKKAYVFLRRFLDLEFCTLSRHTLWQNERNDIADNRQLQFDFKKIMDQLVRFILMGRLIYKKGLNIAQGLDAA